MIKSYVLDAVERACAREAATVRLEMGRGVNGLKTIACIAPLVGVFGTLIGIVNSFPGIGMSKSAAMAMTLGRLSDALVPTELGLLIGLVALCFQRYTLAKLDDFEAEMRNAALQLMNELAVLLRTY